MTDRRLLLMAFTGAGLAGCAAPRVAPARSGGQVMWPLPPEQPRYVYEATLRNGRSVQDESEGGRLKRLLSGDDSERASFGKPLAVAAARGRIYVSDTEGRRVFVFDLPRRRVFSFGVRREGELKKPAGLAVDGQAQVYVIDSTARRLVVFDPLGLYLRAVDGSQKWVRPTALAVNAQGSRTYVIDTGGVESESHRVFVYDGDGHEIGVLGKRGSEPGESNLPNDAAVGPDGTLWVLDAGNFRVQAFDAEGRFLRRFGSAGNAVGQFARPRGLTVDRDGLVYVADASFCNVQVFQPDGTLLLSLGARARSDAPGRYLLPAKLAADETGRIYVVDQFLHKVEVLRRLSDSEGQSILRAAAAN